MTGVSRPTQAKDGKGIHGHRNVAQKVMEAIPSKSIGHVCWYYKRLSSTTFSGPEPGCNSSSQCYDKDSDPKGEKYDGCTNITVSGRTCQVVGFKFSHFLSGMEVHFPPFAQVHHSWGPRQQLPQPE